ncbi:hypothetical protein BU17DRAFT_102437 [Hysterangium stoloniferum]|nr:hypothetical protein BU17DRAFT_102437 [Hysterangium stoloniferum]
METTRLAALFFDPGLPPAALPILTSHMELHSVAHPPCQVLAHEELPHLDATHSVSHPPHRVLAHKELPHLNTTHSVSHPPHQVLDAMHVSTPKAHARTHPKNPVRPRERDIHINPCDDEDQGATSDDTESMLRLSTASNNEVSNDPDTKIPKPDGEPGRPGHGGYNLQCALNWNISAYNKLKTVLSCIHGGFPEKPVGKPVGLGFSL